MEPLFDGLTCSVDIDFHLFFGYPEHVSDVFVALSFEISELHAASLFLRKTVYDLLYHLDTVAMDNLFVGIIGAVWCCFVVERVVVVAEFLDSIKC